MPSSIVLAEEHGDGAPAVQFKVRASASLVRDMHYGAQLIERIVWALADAEDVERASVARDPLRDDARSSTAAASVWREVGASSRSRGRKGWTQRSRA